MDMEFNTVQQYVPSPNAYSFAQPSRTSTPIMYAAAGHPSQPTPQHGIATQPQSQSTWSPANAAPKSMPMQRRNTLTSETSRPQLLEISAPPRPLSVTSQSIPTLGVQSPHASSGFNLQFQPATTESSAWTQQKTCNDYEFPSLETDMSDLNQALISTDEDIPIIDLRQYNSYDQENGQDGYRGNLSRRMSESSFSMSSTGPVTEVPTIEDYSTSEISYTSDCDWNGLEPTPQQLLSPMASPRNSYHEMRRAGSRSRASPVPHANVRTSPYSLDTNRNKRWSTGTYSSLTPPSHTPNRFNNRYSFYGSPLNPNHNFATMTGDFSAPQPPAQNLLYPQPTLPSSTPTLFSTPDNNYPEAPRPLPSQGLFRLLQSNADRLTGCASHFADLSDPPDLYSSLHEEPCNPPESDMNPSDPDLTPHEQDLRFTGDLYTPRWVRGHGNKREGWCGLCKPGRWLVLKNSAFWYDKSFTHGVSAATGAAFQPPQQTRRTEGNLDVWEGLCGSCAEWIPLVSSKKKGTTWFRHAYKCHTHAKVKDGPKRRRETGNVVRGRRGSTSSNFPPGTSHSAPRPESSESDSIGVNTSVDTIKREGGSEPTPQFGMTVSAPPSDSRGQPLRLEAPLMNGSLAASHYDAQPTSTAPTLHVEVHAPQPSQPHQINATKLEVECRTSADQHPHGFETSQPPPLTALATPHSLYPVGQQHGGFDGDHGQEQTAGTMSHDHLHYHGHHPQYPFAPNATMELNMSIQEQQHNLYSNNNSMMPAGLNISHTASHEHDLPSVTKANGSMSNYMAML